MKEKIKTVWRNKKGKWLIISLSAIVILGFGFTFAKSGNPLSSYEVVTVEKGDVIESIEVTGKVVPAKEVHLAIPRSGRIASVNAHAGSQVREGATLVSIENGSIRAELTQAETNLLKETIKYNQLVRASQSDIDNRDTISTEEASVINARNDYQESLREALDKIDNLVNTYVDQFFRNPKTDPLFGITLEDGSTTYTIQSLMKEGARINNAKNQINILLKKGKEEIEKGDELALPNAQKITTETIKILGSLLEDISFVLNSYRPQTTAEESLYGGLKADIYAARNGLRDASASINTASRTLLASEAKVGPEEIKLAELELKDAKTRVEALQSELAETIIRAPFAGTIASIDAKVGEIAGVNSPLVTLMGVGKYEIEAYVPESDIAKVKVGDSAQITLDAYGDDVNFPALVFSINPGETIIEGVATYKVTLLFKSENSKIKSGMTANITIQTGIQKDVIRVPQRSITEKNSEKIIKTIDKEGAITEVPVVVGLRGDEGFTEIISGLEEGDTIVVSKKGK